MTSTAPPPETDRLLAGLVGRIELAEGARLARAGRYREADAALVVSRDEPAGLDLRARMAAQQGRYGEAARLWREAASRLGDAEAFTAEIDAAGGRAPRRADRLASVAVAVTAAGALVFAALVLGASPTAEPTPAGTPDALADRLASVGISRSAMAREGDSLVVTFDEPLPADGAATLPPDLVERLGRIAGAVRDRPSVAVVVTARAEALDPAIDRARAGGAALVDGGVPAGRVTVQASAGDGRAGPLALSLREPVTGGTARR